MVNVTQANVDSLTLVNNTTYTLTEDVVITNVNGFGGNNLTGVVFDGNGHKITVNVAGFNGLFGSGNSSNMTNPGIIVRNLEVEAGIDATYNTPVATAIGGSWFFRAGTSSVISYGRIENCKCIGNMGNMSGGFFGAYTKGYITDSYSIGNIGYACGGIFGERAQSGSVIERCYTIGTIGYNDTYYGGGLCGWYANGVTIKNSFTAGQIVYSNNGRAVGSNSTNITVQNFYSSLNPINPSYENYIGLGITTPASGVFLQNSWSDTGANYVLANSPKVWYSNAIDTPYVFLRDYVPGLFTFTVGGVDILANNSTTTVLPFTNNRIVAATAVSGTISDITTDTLYVGVNYVTATVTDAGKTQTYERTVIIQGSTAATITVNDAAYNGQLTVANAQTAIIIGVTTEDGAARVSGAGAQILSVGLNTLTVTVNGQYGSTQQYPVLIYRKSAATTATISVNGVAVTNGGSVNVPYGTTSVPVSVTNISTGATYSVTGGNNLTAGANTITVVVTAEDTTITQTYTFTVNVAAGSSNTNFNATFYYPGGNEIIFNVNTLSNPSVYHLLAINNTGSVNYAINPTDSNTTIDISGLTHDGNMMPVYPDMFTMGNTYSVLVIATAQSGDIRKVKFDIRIMPPENSLAVFDINNTSYLTQFDNDGTPVIELTSRDNFTYNIGKASNYTYSDAYPYTRPIFDSLQTYTWAYPEENSKIFTFELTLSSHSTVSRTYSFTVTRPAALSSDKTLSVFKINDFIIRDGELFNATSPNVTVTAIPTHPEATAVVSGATGLVIGFNTVSVEVTAQDGSKTTYSVTVYIANILDDPVISLSTFDVPGVGTLHTKLYTFDGVSTPLTKADPSGVVEINENTAKVVGVGTCTISTVVNGVTHSYQINAGKFSVDMNIDDRLSIYTNNFSVQVGAVSQNLSEFYAYMYGAAPAPQSLNLSSFQFEYISSNPIIASISNTGFVTIMDTGSVNITTSYAGNLLFNPVTVTKTYNIAKLTPQTITFNSIPDKKVGDYVALSASASSGLNVAFSVVAKTPQGATITGAYNRSDNTIHLLKAGVFTVKAVQLGDDIYSAASYVTQTFTVTKKAQSITFAAIPNKKSNDAPFTVSASSDSGLPIVYSSSDSSIASINASTGLITLNSSKSGSVTISANQPGNNEWEAATQQQQTFAIMLYMSPSAAASQLSLGSLASGVEVATQIGGSGSIPAIATKKPVTSGAASYTPSDPSLAPVTVRGLPPSITNVSIATSAPINGTVVFMVDAHTSTGVNTHDFTASPLTLTFKIPGITTPTFYKVQKRSAETNTVVSTYFAKASADGTITITNVKSLCEFTASPTDEPLPCFVEGTKILTADGYKAVEKLNAEDRIVTADGRSVVFKLYKTVVAKTTKETAPYMIKAGAFGRSVPAADITLSPLHAIQARKGIWQIPKYAALENTSVRQVAIGESVTYYHVELPNYFTDNIVAEGGVVVESFAAKQTKGIRNIYKYNSTLGGFTRVSHGAVKKRTF